MNGNRVVAVGLTIVVLILLGVLAVGQYPNCGFNCAANDVNVTVAFVNAPDACTVGQTVTVGLYVRLENGTNTNRYAVRFLGDLYVGGAFERSFDECVINTMSPGSSTQLLATISWPCGESLELRDVIVSWSANAETCADTPSCAERKAKCWPNARIPVEGTPLAAFFTSNAPVCDGSLVSFTDQASGGSGSYSYDWDFGDGGASASANPSHLYSAPGTYTATLTVTSSGVTSSYSDTITVNPNPVATAANGGPYCAGDTIELTATGGTSYSWSGPNGFSSSLQNPTIPSATGADAGVYSVIVTDVYGCTDQASTLVEVDAAAPTLTVPADATIECGGSVDPAQTGMATATDDTDPSPTVSYSDVENLNGCGATGTITRTWTATDACGNSVSGTQTITIVDTTSPTLTISSTQFECDGAGNVADISAWLATATATEMCGTVTVTNDYSGLTGSCHGVGSADVTFTATDACGNVTTRTATLTVVDNAAPSAADDTATTDEGVSVPVDVLANDGDVCDPAPSLAAVGTPDFGTASIVGGQIEFTPPAGFDGTATFSYTIEDCSGNTDTALVEITVLPGNGPPVANDESVTAEEDTPLPITVTATDLDGDALTYTILTGPTHGTISGFDPATGEMTYTPDADYHGPDSFTFEACDPEGLCDTGAVTITVEPVDDPPLADPQSLTTPEDTPLPITVTGSDADGDPITYGIVSEPSSGTISGFDPATGDLIYTPDENFTGTDSFVFEACDPHPEHGCSQATVTIKVTPLNDPPTANDDATSTLEDVAIVIGVASNDFDVDGNLDPTTVTVLAAPAFGTVSVNPLTGDVTYTPDLHYHSTDTFIYEICDTDGLCDTATVTVNVVAGDDPPVAQDDNALTSEDQPISIDILANDNDPDGDLDPTSVIVTVQPVNGTVAIDPVTGEATYSPDENFHGQDVFTYQVCDSEGVCDEASVAITVLPVDDPPVANDQSLTAEEDTPLPLTVTATDPDGDTLTFSILSNPTNGTISGFDPATGELIYTPDEDYHGPDTFTFEACDPDGLCDTGTVTIMVEPIDDPPVADPQDLTTPEDTALPITVTGSDVDGDPITYGVVSGPSHGTISGFDPDTGELIYTPAENFNGTDSFVFEACDPHPEHGCAQATVTITVTPVNDPPVALDQSRATSEDTETGFFSLLVSDPDNTLAEIVCDCQVPPSHGTVVRGPDHTVNYIPDPDFSGVDTFTYEICDTDGACGTATVTVTVNPVDDPPVAIDDAVEVAEDGSVEINVPANDSDPDGNLDLTSVAVVSGPSNGTVSVDPITGVITYEPDENFHGTDTFTYEICDTEGACDTGTVTVEVNPVDDPPLAGDDTAQVPEDGSVTINVPVNDTDPDGDLDITSVSIVSQPPNGTVTVDPITGEITYEPDENFEGIDKFTYQICDSVGVCDTATVTVNVLPVDDPPVANDDSTSTAEDIAIVIPVVGNDFDVDGNLDPTTVEIVSSPSNGTVDVDPFTGAVTYTPEADFNGLDTFSYQVCDTDGLCDVADVTVNVGPEDDPPVALDDTGQVLEDGVTTINVVNNDSDPDGNLDPTSVVVTSPPAHGSFSVDPVTGAISYEPNENYNGPDTLVYEICDTNGACDLATVTINVLPVDDPPVALDDTSSVAEDSSVEINVVDNDSDPDGDLDPTSVAVVLDPQHGEVTVDPVTGVVTYEPDENFNGQDTFTYQVCDSEGACGTATVTVNVAPVDDLPVATPQDLTTPEDTALAIGLIGSDADGDPLTYNILTSPSHGVISGFDPATGELIYTPNEDYNGPDSFVFEVCDPHPNECGTATVTIEVLPIDDPPVALDDTTQVSEDGSVEINVPGNDSDPDGNLDLTSVKIVSGPSNGTITIDPITGAITYEPDENFHGTDTFTYEICDTDGACDTATVTVTVNPVDDPPVAVDDAASTPEDVPVQIPVTDNDGDPDGEIDPTTLVIVNGPSHGTVTVDPATGVITYVPSANFGGEDSLVYQVCNTEGACDVAEVVIEVEPANDPPEAACLDTIVIEGTVARVELQSSDPDGDDVTYRIVEDPGHGTIGGFDSESGVFFYSSGACAEVSVDVFVGEDAPQGATVVLPSETVEIHITGGANTSADVILQPAHGDAEVDQLTGTIRYTPSVGYEGPDAFTYWACSAAEEGFSGPVTIVYEVVDAAGAKDQCAVQLFVIAAAGGGLGECEQRVIISEVAWSGTDADPDHEWIELRNLEDEPVDLAGWALRSRRKLPLSEEDGLWKAIPLSGEIAAHLTDSGVEFRPDEDQPGAWWVFWEPDWRDDFFLIERETDEPVLHIGADLIYGEELPLDRIADLDDLGDVIELVDPSGCIVDTANADTPERDGWIAGALVPAATMERSDPSDFDLDENWHTNLGLVRTEIDAWGNLIHGTPKRENSPILSEAVAAEGIGPTPAPMGEPIVLRFDPLPEWPTDRELWRVVVTRPPHDEVLEADWTIALSEDGDILIEIATNWLPLNEELHVWVRTPSGDLLFAPSLLYPY